MVYSGPTLLGNLELFEKKKNQDTDFEESRFSNFMQKIKKKCNEQNFKKIVKPLLSPVWPVLT